MPLKDKSEYCKYIGTGDVMGLANMMKRLSLQEERVISKLLFGEQKNKTR